jgi:hypothetical protein
MIHSTPSAPHFGEPDWRQSRRTRIFHALVSVRWRGRLKTCSRSLPANTLAPIRRRVAFHNHTWLIVDLAGRGSAERRRVAVSVASLPSSWPGTVKGIGRTRALPAGYRVAKWSALGGLQQWREQRSSDSQGSSESASGHPAPLRDLAEQCRRQGGGWACT